jgi:hypothetical protein
MTDMGSHSHPNGHRGEDGATATSVIAPVLHVRQLGPMSPWPALDQTLTEEMAEAAAAAARAVRRNVDADTVIRVLTAAVVLTVAAIAAVVSYSHIFDLGRMHGQDGVAARLLPLSVDGLIAAASLVMLHAARNGIRMPWLARWMLGLGVGATVAANVAYGLPFGWLGSVVSAWPAVAFVGSVEMAVRFVRDAREVATGGAPDAAAGAPPAGDIGSGGKDAPMSQEPAPEPQQHRDTEPPSPRRQVSRKPRTGSDRARDILRRKPDTPKAEVARRAGITVRQVERVISDMEGAAK